MVYEIEKILKEHGDKVDDSVKETIEAKKKDLETAKEGDDAAAIEKAVEALAEASQEVAQKMYAEQQAAGATSTGGGRGWPQASGGAVPVEDEPSKEDENVIDADFEVKS